MDKKYKLTNKSPKKLDRRIKKERKCSHQTSKVSQVIPSSTKSQKLNKKTKRKLKTKWWFIWILKNGYTKVGEVLNFPPERIRIKIKTNMVDIDFLMREGEAKGILYGLAKVIFEIGNKKVEKNKLT